MATLVFDGPGQGEAQYDFAIRGDYEVPVKAVIDFVGTRGDLDSARDRHVGRVSSAAITRPAPPRSTSASRPASRSAGPFDMGAAWDACRS